ALCSYLRYNALLQPAWCREHLGAEFSAADLKALEAMDEPKNISKLDALGRLTGMKMVKPEHFGAAFDL
ncbi:MAG: hypothetical protein OEW22_11315, partial [Rubrivivax sp.]|nr:hypothetical protein [Rubrivivax sp.]